MRPDEYLEAEGFFDDLDPKLVAAYKDMGVAQQRLFDFTTAMQNGDIGPTASCSNLRVAELIALVDRLADKRQRAGMLEIARVVGRLQARVTRLEERLPPER